VDWTETPWQPLHDLTLRSYYLGDLGTGRWACETLLSVPDVPESYRALARSNQVFYAPLLSDLAPSFYTRSIDFDIPPSHFPYNCTVAVDGEGYRAVVRCADILTGTHWPYQLPTAAEGQSYHANYGVQLDRDLTVKGARLVAQPVKESEDFERGLAGWGIADCRLFRWHDQWYVSGSTIRGHPDLPTSMVLLRLDGTTFHDLVLLSDPAIKKDEKNWMPVVRGDDLLFVYSISPTVVLRYTPNGIEELIRHPGPYVLRHYRGGSQGLDLGDGYLFVIHESVLLDNRTRAYPHRFVRTDADFHVTHVSTPFFFLARYVEFCCGMALRDDDLVISFGFMDREAYVSRTTLDEILALLRAVYG